MTLNGEMALILHYFTEFGSVRGALRYFCVKVVDKDITMDNLQLLCLVVNVCRGTARRQRYKYCITSRWKFCNRLINSRLNAQYYYLPCYRLIWYFEVRVRYRRKKFTFAISSPDEFFLFRF